MRKGEQRINCAMFFAKNVNVLGSNAFVTIQRLRRAAAQAVPADTTPRPSLQCCSYSAGIAATIAIVSRTATMPLSL
jgi:hypothetical protein